MYVVIARPFYGLLIVFIWTEECERSFQKLKECLTSAPILKSPDWNVIFHVHIDASNFAIGAILAQPGEKNMDFPISYASRQLNSAEQNYTTIEREGLGMVYVVKKLWHYLLASKFVFFTDHQALLYLVINKPFNIGRIVRWFIILLEFHFIVVVKKGKTHQRANHLSRLTHREKPVGVEDDLPDAYLLNIEMVQRWSEELIPLLTIGQLNIPKPLRERKLMIQKSSPFVMLAGRMYNKGQVRVL